MNMRQVWGLAGGFFFVYILITLTNKPKVRPRTAEPPAAEATSAAAPEDAASPSAGPSGSEAPAVSRFRGFTLQPADGKAFGGFAEAAMRELAAAGVRGVSLSTPITQATATAAEVDLTPPGLEDTRGAVKAAKAAGLQVMLRPLVQPADGARREDVAPPDATKWITSYRKALGPLLAMAEAEKVDLVCVGTGLAKVQGPGEWGPLIGEARTTYHGRLTYAARATGDGDFRQVKFWSELDYVGIDAFFPLADVAGPQDKDLEAGWERVATDLEAWRPQGGADKPILFTTAGFPRLVGAAADPGRPNTSAPEDARLQAAAYRAFFSTVWARPWLAGVFWHTWSPGSDPHDPYAVAGQPAEAVVKEGFK